MTESFADPSSAPANEAQAQLLRAALGDRSAFEALFRNVSGALLAVCLRLIPDRAEAEDVLQESFVAIWHKADQFDPQRATAMTWMIAIARNKAIDRLRGSAHAFKRASVEIADELDDDAPSPAERAESISDAELLRTCLEALEPRRRQLIRTAFFDGETYEELARRTGSPIGSVKSWIRRGLLQLRACLEQ
ncbi:sigma-70 family RNA polymerase sigma factor [Lysobacter firmicutimachus]|uniref:Sigma-70 family RNA polymerase sigma factor n=1 Tax=Lysobacter firmicutimachus TaxID=1792846 RepID=A0AAU8MYR8_9GAMM